MSLITIAYERNDANQLPFQNVNPNRRLMIDDVAGTIVWWDDINGVPLFTIGAGGGSFLPLAGGSMTDGAVISSSDGVSIKMIWNNTLKSWTLVTDDGLGNTSQLTTTPVLNTLSQIIFGAGSVPTFGTIQDALMPFINPLTRGFIASELRIRSFSVPVFASDVLAGAGGLATGDLWQQPDGFGGFTMKVKS